MVLSCFSMEETSLLEAPARKETVRARMMVLFDRISFYPCVGKSHPGPEAKGYPAAAYRQRVSQSI